MVLETEGREAGEEGIPVGLGHFAERGAHFVGSDATGVGEGGLNRHGVRFDEEGLEDRVKLAVDLSGFGEIIGEGKFSELNHFFGEKVGSNTDDPFGTDRHEGKREAVVAAKDGDVFAHRLLELVDAVDRTAGFFNITDMRVLGPEAFDDRHADFDSATTRYGIKDDRLVGRLSERGEVAEETFLARLVIVWSHDEHTVGTGFVGKTGLLDGLVRGI